MLTCACKFQVEKGKAAFERLLSSGQLAVNNISQVPWSLIFDGIMSDSERLPEGAMLPATGVDRETEWLLSATLVKPMKQLLGSHPSLGCYGTRSQTAIAVMRDGSAELRERSISACANIRHPAEAWTWNEVTCQFCISQLADAAQHAL